MMRIRWRSELIVTLAATGNVAQNIYRVVEVHFKEGY